MSHFQKSNFSTESKTQSVWEYKSKLLSYFIVFSQSRVRKVKGGDEKMNKFAVETLSKNTFCHKLRDKVFSTSRPSVKTLDNIQKTFS